MQLSCIIFGVIKRRSLYSLIEGVSDLLINPLFSFIKFFAYASSCIKCFVTIFFYLF